MFNDELPPIQSIEYGKSTPDVDLMRTRSESSGLSLSSRQRRRRARSLRQEQQQPSPDSHKTSASLGEDIMVSVKESRKMNSFRTFASFKITEKFSFSEEEYSEDNVLVQEDTKNTRSAPFDERTFSFDSAERRSNTPQTVELKYSTDSTEAPPQKLLPLSKDPRFSRYFLMLHRARMPIDRVKKIIETDGKDPSILDWDPKLPYETQLNGGPNEPEEELHDDPILSLKPAAAPKRQRGGGTVWSNSVSRIETFETDRWSLKPSSLSEERPTNYGGQASWRTNIKEKKNMIANDLSALFAARQRPSPKSASDEPAAEIKGASFAELENRANNVAALFASRATQQQEKENSTIDLAAAAYKTDGSTPFAASQQVVKNDGRTAASSAVTALFASRANQENQIGDTASNSKKKMASNSVAALFASRANQENQISATTTRSASEKKGSNAVTALFASRANQENQITASGDSGASTKTSSNAVAALFANRANQENQITATNSASGSEKKSNNPVPALFASRANQENVGVGGNSSNNNVAALFAKRAAQQENGNGSSTAALLASLPEEETSANEIKTTNDDGQPALKDDPEYQKYFKMLKMGLPLGSVKNSMQRDGKDSSILDLDHNKPLALQQQQSEDNGVPLKDDPEYQKYFKMLKMGLPLGAVKQSMVRDKKDSTILDLDPEKPLSAQKAEKKEHQKSTKPKKPGVARKRLFWNSIDKSNLQGSMWEMHSESNLVNLNGLEYDEEEFAKLFTKKAAKPKSDNTEKKEAPKRKKKQEIQLIDSRRQMNGCILLAKYKHDYVKLAQTVNRMCVLITLSVLAYCLRLTLWLILFAGTRGECAKQR